MKPISIYIHIPFCKQKCFYCDFNSFSGKEDSIDIYISSLINELEQNKDRLRDYVINTVFIGGGTPSILNNESIIKIMGALREYFRLSKNAEISIEVNPGTINKEKLNKYFNLGINRISIGLQSCQDKHLKLLGRIHSFDEYIGNLRDARDVGFSNINTDLIFALPTQTVEEWTHCINEIIKLKIPHISTYSLIIEKGTPFHNWREDDLIETVDEEIDLRMYKEGITILKENGYKHYEISNFACKGYECLHNINYWKNGEYIGIGAGAHSHFDHRRHSNYSELDKYIKAICEKKSPIEEVINNDLKDEISETMFLGLRLVDGLLIEEFNKRFGKRPIDIYGKELIRLRDRNLIEYNDKIIRLTDEGLYLSNIVFQALLL